MQRCKGFNGAGPSRTRKVATAGMTGLVTMGFNGAGPSRTRKVAAAAISPAYAEPLQWGRALSDPERSASRGRRPEKARFNGAGPSRTRKEHAQF